MVIWTPSRACAIREAARFEPRTLPPGAGVLCRLAHRLRGRRELVLLHRANRIRRSTDVPTRYQGRLSVIRLCCGGRPAGGRVSAENRKAVISLKVCLPEATKQHGPFSIGRSRILTNLGCCNQDVLQVRKSRGPVPCRPVCARRQR
jgi:hypothetical protein